MTNDFEQGAIASATIVLDYCTANESCICHTCVYVKEYAVALAKEIYGANDIHSIEELKEAGVDEYDLDRAIEEEVFEHAEDTQHQA